MIGSCHIFVKHLELKGWPSWPKQLIFVQQFMDLTVFTDAKINTALLCLVCLCSQAQIWVTYLCADHVTDASWCGLHSNVSYQLIRQRGRGDRLSFYKPTQTAHVMHLLYSTWSLSKIQCSKFAQIETRTDSPPLDSGGKKWRTAWTNSGTWSRRR